MGGRFLRRGESGRTAGPKSQEREFGRAVEPARLLVGLCADDCDADLRVRLAERRRGLEVAPVDLKGCLRVLRHVVLCKQEPEYEIRCQPGAKVARAKKP